MIDRTNDAFETELRRLTEKIIGCAFRVSNELGCGFLEKVYENALRCELVRAGIDVEQQLPIDVHYKEKVVGKFFADLSVADTVIVEVKAVTEVSDRVTAQCINYVKATNMPLCLMLNFGKPRVEIKRFRL